MRFELCMVNDDIIIVYAIEHAIYTQLDMRRVLNKTKNSKRGHPSVTALKP